MTGQAVGPESTGEEKQAATSAFVKAWDYSFMYNTPLDEFIFGDKRTKMGHCVFAAGGTDFDQEKFELFEDAEDIYSFDFFEAYGERDPKEICDYFNKNYRIQTERYPDCVNTSGIYVTGMSGLIEVCGWDMLLLAAGGDYHAFGQVMERYAKWIQSYFEGLACQTFPLSPYTMTLYGPAAPSCPWTGTESFCFPSIRNILLRFWRRERRFSISATETIPRLSMTLLPAEFTALSWSRPRTYPTWRSITERPM